MDLKFKRNRKYLLLTILLYITLIMLAGSQPIISYTIG